MPVPSTKRSYAFPFFAVVGLLGIVAWRVWTIVPSRSALAQTNGSQAKEDVVVGVAPAPLRAISPSDSSLMEASPIPTRTILPQIREELVWEKRYEGMSIPELKAALLDLHQELNQRKERAAKAQGESSALVFDRVEDCYAGATGPRIVVPRIQPETLQPQFVVLQEHHHPELYRLKRELRWVVRQRTQLARDVQASRPPRPIRRADMLASKRSRPEPRGTD